MSFKIAISDVLVCNEALALLPADPISTMNEQSLEGRECRRSYKPVVAEMLEMHHWGLATRRSLLAAMPNDRAGEWAFAYARPADMAYPVSALALTGAYYSGWFVTDGLFTIAGRPVFIQVGDTIYSNIQFATLEYTSFNITEANFTNLFKKAVVVELAARICHAITKNAKRAQELTAAAEFWRQRIVAQDMNRSQPTYGNRPTESELARFGLIGGIPGAGPVLDPVADPIGAVIVSDFAAPGDFYYEG